MFKIKIWLYANPTGECRHVAMGVEYLNRISMVHGDLKGANVLISELGQAKLTDFGSSTLRNHTVDFSGASHGSDFSTQWAAPELIVGPS
ncbi:hypothetical protein BDV93DRAFT_584277, partial [Ceratobasidium sp. AG-I]